MSSEVIPAHRTMSQALPNPSDQSPSPASDDVRVPVDQGEGNGRLDELSAAVVALKPLVTELARACARADFARTTDRRSSPQE